MIIKKPRIEKFSVGVALITFGLGAFSTGYAATYCPNITNVAAYADGRVSPGICSMQPLGQGTTYENGLQLDAGNYSTWLICSDTNGFVVTEVLEENTHKPVDFATCPGSTILPGTYNFGLPAATSCSLKANTTLENGDYVELTAILSRSGDGTVCSASDIVVTGGNFGPAVSQMAIKGGFLKLDTTSGSAPESAECSQDSHNGRMVVDPVNDLLYICTQSGWTNTSLTAP